MSCGFSPSFQVCSAQAITVGKTHVLTSSETPRITLAAWRPKSLPGPTGEHLYSQAGCAHDGPAEPLAGPNRVIGFL